MEHKFKQDLRVVNLPIAEPLQVTKDLEAAKKLLKKGWCQEKLYCKRFFGLLPRQYCILGALDAVAAEFQCYVIIGDGTGKFKWIGEWNDVPGRKQSEVIDLFDRAIATSIIGG